jgi:hypothetical protein
MDKSKEELTKELLHGTISEGDMDRLMKLIDRSEYRGFIKRIFDINESELVNNSDAASGILGVLNRFARKRKNAAFKRNILKPGYREGKKLIIAEGDSWFEYPLFLNDILDWIKKLSDNPVYSLAYGGDWIANIIFEEQYIAELTTYQPEVFLISGGGNDLVGGGRLSTLVNKPALVDKTINDNDRALYRKVVEQDFGNTEITRDKRAEMIMNGNKYINKDFLALLYMFELMYKVFFRGIDLCGKFDDMKIITQGYDFAIPSDNRNIFKFPLRAGSNGDWLCHPLVIKGVYDPLIQKSILSAMIYHFNEMLIKVATHCNKHKGSNFVFHIDSRAAVLENEWADELHPFSRAFKRIGQAFVDCINAPDTNDPNASFVKAVRLNK